MTRRSRIWIGVTLLTVLVLNYAMISIPLAKRRASMQKRAGAIIVSKNADDDYVLDIFRKELALADRRMAIINSVSISFAVIILSWTIFGLIIRKRK